MSRTYSESIPEPLLIPSSAVSGFGAHLPTGRGCVLAAHRYVQGVRCGLSAGIFAHLFCSMLDGYPFLVRCILACSAGFVNAVGKLFLGLVAFAVGRIQIGLGRKLRFF